MIKSKKFRKTNLVTIILGTIIVTINTKGRIKKIKKIELINKLLNLIFF